MKKNIPCFLIFLFVYTLLTASGLETPEKFLGFKPGTDRQLAHYNKIKDYFFKAEQESPRIKIIVIGKTTLNNDMIMAVISSPENIKELDKYKEISRKLSLAEVNEIEAQKLAEKGKAIVFINCNLHSSEIASSQMSMEMLYRMATDDSPETLKILNNIIFILVPSVNPDGQIMTVEWYYKQKGTPYEGSDTPYLYHWYAGHDNNRDWYKINLKETANLTKQLYHDFFPQILVDEHQMGSSGDRLFIPPFADPPTPGLHPLMWRTVNLIGSRIAFDLEKLNLQGVASRGIFMGWWIGALDDSAWFHNVAGILFEGASVRLATPIYIEPEEVSSPVSRKNEERVFSPNPWKGGWWRLGDIVNYDFHATLSVLNTAANNSQELLMNSYKMASDNINKGKNEAPFAYIVPKNQRDSLTVEKFIYTLTLSNIQVYSLDKSIQSGNQFFEKGSYVVPLAQPYRAFVKNIFEYQRYPEIGSGSKEDVTLPYDGAGWTLHLGMGVDVVEAAKTFDAPMSPVNPYSLMKKTLPDAWENYIIFDPAVNNSYMAVSVLMKKGFPVWRNYTDSSIPSGSFVTANSPACGSALKEINEYAPILTATASNLPVEKYVKLKTFKLGLYQNYGENMEEGWARFVLDQFKIDYETIHPKDFAKKDFIKKFDILVFLGASTPEIESGKPPKKWEMYYSPVPAEYSSGIGEEGLKILEEFLKSGKTLVFMTSSCDYAIGKLKLPVENLTATARNLICPGSYLKVEIKESELTFGMPDTAAMYFNDSPAFKTSPPRSIEQDRRTPVVFGKSDLLLSGTLRGEEQLVRKSVVADISSGGGRVILVGPDIIFRGQSEGTYKILFNALFSAAKVK